MSQKNYFPLKGHDQTDVNIAITYHYPKIKEPYDSDWLIVKVVNEFVSSTFNNSLMIIVNDYQRATWNSDTICGVHIDLKSLIGAVTTQTILTFLVNDIRSQFIKYYTSMNN